VTYGSKKVRLATKWDRTPVVNSNTIAFRAKEFLPGGVHYNLNPRELFRGPHRLNLGVGASLSHRYP
jgi:hypothetical protein